MLNQGKKVTWCCSECNNFLLVFVILNHKIKSLWVLKCWLDKMISLYCDAAFKPSRGQHLSQYNINKNLRWYLFTYPENDMHHIYYPAPISLDNIWFDQVKDFWDKSFRLWYIKITAIKFVTPQKHILSSIYQNSVCDKVWQNSSLAIWQQLQQVNSQRKPNDGVWHLKRTAALEDTYLVHELKNFHKERVVFTGIWPYFIQWS